MFNEISNNFHGNIGQIFKNSYLKMKNKNVKESWEESIDQTNTNLNKEDKEIIKGLGKMLGKTDVEGQISQLNLICEFIDTQIANAENERIINEKLYKKLGIIIGLTMVIALI